MAGAPAAPPRCFSFQSADLDHARAAVRDTFFPVSLDLLGTGTPHRYRFDGAALGPVVVGEAWNRAGLRVGMADPDTAYYVLFAQSGRLHSEHRGFEVTVTAHAAAVYGPVGGSVIRSGDDAVTYSVAVGAPALQRAVEDLLGRAVPAPPALAPRLDLAGGLGPGRAGLADTFLSRWRSAAVNPMATAVGMGEAPGPKRTETDPSNMPPPRPRSGQPRRCATMGPMATPPESTRSSLTLRLQQHARTHWPQLAELRVRFRGGFAYVEGRAGDDDVLPLCRLRYAGSANTWGFALYLASSDRYEDQVLPTGGFAGTPEEALDCACGLYLAGPTL